MVIDGRYLVTMNTIGEQGGLKATERLFQTVNSLIRKQLELHNNGERRTMMNYTAATLMAAAVALGGCVPNQQDAGTGMTQAQYPKWKWKREVGPAEILPDGAHIRMNESGTVLQIIFLESLEGEDGLKAQAFLQNTIDHRKTRCSWLEEPARQGDPRATTEDGYPIASCRVRKQQAVRCGATPCHLNYKAIKAGYGRLSLGPWQSRTKAGHDVVPLLMAAQAKAREARKGIWSE